MYNCTHHGWESDERQCPLCLYPHIQPISAVLDNNGNWSELTEDAKKEFGSSNQFKILIPEDMPEFDEGLKNMSQKSIDKVDGCILEHLTKEIKDKNKEVKELKEALEYLMEGVRGLPPLSSISGTLITHFDKAKQVLNKK